MSCNTGSVLFLGDYVNPQQQLWASAYDQNSGAANLQVSSLTVNSYPTGNIILQSKTNDGTEYNAPILFQRPPGDINSPFEGLVMNKSISVPTYPVDGEFITAVKSAGTVYDDIAVNGLQIYGNQTTSGNAGARGYITGGPGGIFINTPSVTTSSITVSSIFVGTVVSTTTGSANSYTASIYMSTPVLYTSSMYAKGTISTNGINNTSGIVDFGPGTLRGNALTSQILLGPAQQVSMTTNNLRIDSISTNKLSTNSLAASTINTNRISTNTISTNTAAINLATISTLNVRNLAPTFVSSINIFTDYIDVSRVAHTAGLAVDGNAFYGSNLTGTQPNSILLWNGPVKTFDSVTTPAMYIFNGPFGSAYISTNASLPYGMSVYSDAFAIRSPTGYPYTPLATSTSNIATQNLIEVINFVSPAISTVNISTNNLFAGQTYATTATASIANSILANISTAIISTVNIGNFSATKVDTNTLSSLTSQVNISLISTLQLKADIGISPNFNLGLGNVIQGLVGGASAQGLAVGVGTVGLATGATAMVTGRQSGGVNTSVFQTVNGSTQLQFSTIGAPTTSVFLNTDSTDPLHAPGNLTQVSQLVPAGTYCVRSVGDPLNVDSSTQGIQMFGQWVPVVQPTATIARVAISSLTTSTINSATATISSLTVSTLNVPQDNFPSTLSASTITFTGSAIGTNSRAPLRWPGPAYLPSTITNQTQFTDSSGVVTGRIIGSLGFDEGINMIAPNGFLVQNAVNGIARFNDNGTTSVFSTLQVEDIQCYNTGYFSTLVVSTLQAVVTPVFPSTLYFSSMNLTGNLTGPNPNGTLTWAGPASFPTQVGSTHFGFINAFNTTVSVIRTNTDNNLVWNYPNITMLSGPPGNAISSMVFNANGNVRMISTLNCLDTVVFGRSPTATPYISTNIDNTLGSEGIFFGGSTMTLKSDYVMRLEVGAGGANPFLASLYDAGLPTEAVGIQIQGGPMNFQGIGIDGPLNYATFNLNAQFNRSTIMKGPYTAVSTLTVSTLNATRLTNNLGNISSLTVSSIQTATNGPIGVPPGCIMNWAGGGDNFNAAPPPTGWLLCDGRQYPTTTYPDLYAVIGTTYNRYTPLLGYFFVPDLRFTFPMAPPTFTTGPTAMVNAPVVTVYSLPTNLGITGVLPNQIWRVVTSKNGVLAPGMYFGTGTGPNFQVAYIDKMLDGTGDVGTYIMGSIGVGTWPVIGSVGTPATQTVVGVGQGQGQEYSYKIGTINATGYSVNPGYVDANDFYKWGFNINGSNVGIPGATPNVHGGIMNTYASPVSVGGLAFPTAPNFMNMLSIIKY